MHPHQNRDFCRLSHFIDALELSFAFKMKIMKTDQGIQILPSKKV